MNTEQEIIDLAHELMEAEGLPLAEALDAAALVLDAVSDAAVAWDRMAKELREDELVAFAAEWDQECARLQALAA